ncbi:NB-ARC domain-containing protein [Tumidithrix elongata RA019]|uniref:NB-ARC domain-containing protein n=1 Tax=Tumidithrix elongata BACA0141 TaxID=2716417 RepID=A0AAW9PUL4_9CYAN|nr:NB-ARC domain-containing protein [Tumidithrix elongata RA019]
MTADEALAFIEMGLEQRSLTKVERSVFLGVWQGLSYSEIAKQSDYDPGYIKLVSHKLWHLLTQALGEKVSKSTLQSIVRKHLHSKKLSVNVSSLNSESNSRQDWGEVVDVSVFYGRTNELNTLEQWIEIDHCRLIAILGMGGLGKTALSVKLSQQIQDKFDFVVWRSLSNAKSPEEKLIDVIKFLSGQRETEFSSNLEDLISKLLEYLQQHRCLIVLDNFESVLQSGNHAGSYRSGYEGYGVLLKRVGEVSHHSCLVITSREMPEEVAMLEGDILPVRFLPLEGIDEIAAEHVLHAKGLFSQPHEIQKLVNWYRGNPLALKIAATSIKEVFSGSVARFLEQKNTIFSGITNLIDQQFRRLTPLEKQVMFWLAINRESAQAEDLKSDIVPKVEQSDLFAALGSLKRRSLIEDSLFGFTQQPVVMEYITGLLIDQVYQEIAQEQPLGVLPSIQAKLHKQLFYLRHYALMQATAKDYVRYSQIRFIIEPLIVKLLSSLGTKQDIAEILFQTLQELRRRDLRSPEGRSTPGYGGGNIINLLAHLNVDLAGKDFSHLTIRQAYLPDVKLHRVNFSHSEIVKSVFAEVLGGVLSVTFSPNGKLLAIGDTRGEIHLWRVRDSKPLQTYKGHTSWVRSITFNPSGTMLASSSNDQTIKLWDVQTGACLKTFHGEIGPIMSVSFSPDGQILASGNADRTVRLWDVGSGLCFQTLQGHEDIVGSVAYSPKGNLLASSSDDQTIRLWDVETGECIRTLEGHADIVWSIAFSPNGNVLASSSEDHTIKLWNVETGSCLKTLTGHNHIVFSVSFSHDGSTLASGSGDRTIRLWNLKTAKCFKTLIGHNHWVRAVAFDPHSLVLASSSGDEMVKLWEISTAQCIKTFQGHIGRSWSASKGEEQNTAGNSNDHLQNLWEVNSGQQFRILQGYTNAIWSVAFHPTSSYKEDIEGIVASGSDDSIVRLWDIRTGECVKSLSGHAGRVWSVAFSPDGNTLASCSEDCTIKLWHIKSGNCITTINEHPDEVRTLAFSHDGQFLVTGDMGHTVKLWRVLTGEKLQIFEGHSRAVLSVVFSHDNQMLASSSRDKTVKLWRVSTGECLQTLNGHTEAIASVALNTEGTLVATGSSASTVRLWQVETGECLQVINGHEGNVLSVAFSPNSCALNQTLISGSEDCTVKVWDLNTKTPILTLEGHTGTVHSVAVSADGKVIASGSRDETIKLWDLTTGKCFKTLREPRPYEELNITGAIGLSSAQKSKLLTLGAIELE